MRTRDNYITIESQGGAIARERTISHQHLTDTIEKGNGHHPGYFYHAKIVNQTTAFTIYTNLSIAGIALTLRYAPSDFSKFFPNWTGYTPGTFRKNHQQNILNHKKTEKFTIVHPLAARTFVKHSLKN